MSSTPSIDIATFGAGCFWGVEAAFRQLAGVTNASLELGDGSIGWPDQGPYDAICVTAACPRVPPALVDQLKMGGRLLLPVGTRDQQILRTLRKTESGLESEDISPVIFVPLIGEQGW